MKEIKTVCLNLPRSLWEELKKYAESNDLTVSQIIRKGIMMFLKEVEK